MDTSRACSEGLTASQSAPATSQMAHMNRMVILYLWGMRERRFLKRARERISNKAPREPIDAMGHKQQPLHFRMRDPWVTLAEPRRGLTHPLFLVPSYTTEPTSLRVAWDLLPDLVTRTALTDHVQTDFQMHGPCDDIHACHAVSHDTLL